MQLDLNQLRELLADFDKTNISELTLKSEDFELTVRKEISLGDRPLQPIDSLLATGVARPEWVAPVAPIGSESPGRSAPSTTPPPTVGPLPIETRFFEVTSPMVGTFYRSPAPNEPPFVNVGDRIGVGQSVCIIEAMKLMNEIESESSGRVIEILVDSGAPVEYGQTLMRIKPD
ncbi:MAG: acetyl-CoA carboxylase biotin carboxyl carrier protein [Microcoleaceae cyanobacterium]